LKSGEPLIPSVPRPVRADISLFIRSGFAVLDAIEKNNYNILEKRPIVSRWTKLRLLLSSRNILNLTADRDLR
jgi:hypothetical protein